MLACRPGGLAFHYVHWSASLPDNRSFEQKSYIEPMKTLTLTVPDSLDITNKDLSMLIATRLYEQGKLSLGQAADLAGLTKRSFAELLAKYEISIFNFPASDIANDVANA